MTAAAILVLDSKNSKTGPVAVTYASIASTCPASCPLKGSGCYAQDGRVAMVVRRLDSAGATAEQAACDEARLIDAVDAPEGRALRLHASGDASTARAARLLGRSVAGWRARGGGPAWTYTHAWRTVARKAWGPAVSILASVESTKAGARALARGYAPAVVVAEHPADGRAFERDGIRWVPCPEQTRGVQCADCKLCWDADGLAARRTGIAFAVHGARKKRVLTVIQ